MPGSYDGRVEPDACVTVCGAFAPEPVCGAPARPEYTGAMAPTADAAPPSFPAIAVLGAGSMGRAIIHGLLSSPTAEIAATVNSAASAGALDAEFGGRVRVVAAEAGDANASAVRGARIVVVAVKPRYVAEVVAEVAPHLDPSAIVVSVAAGVTIDAIRALLPTGTAVVRVMPNTPSLVGKGISGVVFSESVTPAQAELVRALFRTIGDVVDIPEAKIDALAAVSGSGPAYFYLFVEKLTEAAADLGFDADTARRLVDATFVGSAALLAASDRSPAELRAQVTSPGGTTMEAVAVFETGGLVELAARAYDAAIAKAKLLA